MGRKGVLGTAIAILVTLAITIGPAAARPNRQNRRISSKKAPTCGYDVSSLKWYLCFVPDKCSKVIAFVAAVCCPIKVCKESSTVNNVTFLFFLHVMFRVPFKELHKD